MAKYEIDAYTDRPCARCGSKTTTFSVPGSDKGLCKDCIVQGIKTAPRPRVRP